VAPCQSAQALQVKAEWGAKSMPQKGFVYILSNSSMPNKVKVGKSIKVPTERAKELGTTGVPTSFEVQYYAFFDDMDEAEKRAHNTLSQFHHAKEFFDTDVPTAIHAIESVGISFQKLFSKPEDDARAEEIIRRRQVEERIRQERERLHQEKINEERQERREQRERREKIETRTNLVWSLVIFVTGITAIVSAFKYEGGLLEPVLFWGGIVVCYYSGKKLLHNYRKWLDA
jgi:hypothetical protein